ncbi:unnamed protein product [Acanthoscelides obtectus]|uniref:Uncharacterized protein n=1 Tax=Acanthoscelides obtectus TaxID=200917 RepID=A0A9P0Q321_ACAOB|nr:unnamed protein product [Acanthoscelides obtectus]CAK1649761.1 hypothetical protein AOBTE_LOCUS16410 [Acanthoscelides obtectus]
MSARQTFKLPTVWEGKPVAVIRPFNRIHPEEENWDDPWPRTHMGTTPPHQPSESRTPMNTTPQHPPSGSRTPMDTTPVSRYGVRNPAPEVAVEENWDEEAGSNSDQLIQVPMQRSIPPGMGRGARLRWIIQERRRLRQVQQ